MPPKPTVIAFDTSAAHCAAALLLGDRVITRIDEMAKGQAEHLMPMLEDMLRAENLSWRDLDGIGVGVGPGNFTGIRIAVASARGLALSLGIPAVGVPLLQTYAPKAGTVLALGDARQDRLYAQLYRDGTAQAPIDLTTIDALGLSAPQPDWQIIGHRAEEVCERLGARGWAARSHVDLTALARIAADALAAGDVERPAPVYVRPADAAPSSDPVPVMLD